MRIKWIEYKGKKILFGDYSNLKGDELLKVLNDSEDIFKKLSNPVPILLDFTDCYINKNFMNNIKAFGMKYDHLILKTADVGITGLQKIFVTAYNNFTGQGHKIKCFDNIDDAKEFLAE